MRHYSCDLCGKDLTGAHAARFVVRMELVAAAEPPAELTAADLDADPVAAMAEMLEELEAEEALGGVPAPPPASRRMEFDLCAGCQRRFAADPLGRARGAMRFSKN